MHVVTHSSLVWPATRRKLHIFYARATLGSSHRCRPTHNEGATSMIQRCLLVKVPAWWVSVFDKRDKNRQFHASMSVWSPSQMLQTDGKTTAALYMMTSVFTTSWRIGPTVPMTWILQSYRELMLSPPPRDVYHSAIEFLTESCNIINETTTESIHSP